MRESGVLLPISALPSNYGIGCFDQAAYQFIDFLSKAKQTYWQILPLGITGYGDSPYQSFSTYAGNPYFISLDELCENGWISEEDLPEKDIHKEEVDYAYLYEHRYKLLRKAYENSHIENDEGFISYSKKNAWWLDDYALFMAIKSQYENKSWLFWPQDIRSRDENVLAKKREELSYEMNYHRFMQYIFWTQWYRLKEYAHKMNVAIIGDIPIYVAFDSSDVWSHPELFQLDEDVKPEAVAGVPPDGFSATGQLWGNPLYRWNVHEKTNYEWWIARMAYARDAYDVVRIDHFRGFDEYYSIPYGDETAVNGHWEKGPGLALFKAIESKLGKMNVIAEDLGYLTDSVKQLVKDCQYPGMKILQFAFDSRDSSGANSYLPHNYIENSVVYTGTHDNETMMGWFDSILPIEKKALKEYLKIESDSHEEWLDACLALVFSSVSRMCIIPLQDYLMKDNSARMNTPNTLGGNWMWRVLQEELTEALNEKMKTLTTTYHRY
jgi:4-alpha-glucanotransferase